MKACCVPVGSHSALTVTFHLRHQVGYYVMDYYIPSILLVITSWVAFWLDTDAVSGRIIIGQSKYTACSAVHTASLYLSVHGTHTFQCTHFAYVHFTPFA
jgi:hypothetical protein